MTLPRREWWVLLLVTAICAAPPPAPAGPLTSAAASAPAPEPEQIRAAIAQLTHPVRLRRREAIRKLAGWGPHALPELRAAAAGNNLETALSARDLLGELESAVFLGAQVRLETSHARIDWDEPLTLTILAHNPGPGPIRLPWATPNTPATRPAGDADQIARMLDAADFLVVAGPDGKRVELRVEPIERDPEVYREVEMRAQDRGPSQEIPPGATARLDLPHFNRGWARYPLLERGRYTIRLEYQPEWKDVSWRKDGFGRVRSAPLILEVTQPAPAEIAASGRPLRLRIDKREDALLAVVTNCWDLPVSLNCNLNGPRATHAMLEWRLVTSEGSEAIELEPAENDAVFRPEKLLQLAPGESRAIARVAEGEIEQHRKAGAGKHELRVRYASLKGPTQLREELERLGRPLEIPTSLFTGVLDSGDAAGAEAGE